jgi:hypothetical protein
VEVLFLYNKRLCKELIHPAVFLQTFEAWNSTPGLPKYYAGVRGVAFRKTLGIVSKA